MSRDSFDDIDRALASGLSALAPEVAGADEALASLRPQFQRARSRNRAMKVAGAVAVLVLIGSVAALAAPSSRHAHVEVAAPPTTAPTPTSKPPRTTTTSSSTTTSVAPVTTTTIPSGLAAGTLPRHHFIPPPAPVVTVPQTTPATAPSQGPSGGNGSSHPTTTTTNTVPAPPVYTYRSPGGHIKVQFSHGKLTLLGVFPANTYGVMDQREDPTFISISFSSDHGGWRIRVFLVKGQPVDDVDPV
jgi:hypothetical protein